MEVDALHVLAWQNTQNGAKGHHKPKSILEMMNEGNKKEDKIMAFNSGAEFEEYRKRLIHGC